MDYSSGSAATAGPTTPSPPLVQPSLVQPSQIFGSGGGMSGGGGMRQSCTVDQRALQQVQVAAAQQERLRQQAVQGAQQAQQRGGASSSSSSGGLRAEYSSNDNIRQFMSSSSAVVAGETYSGRSTASGSGSAGANDANTNSGGGGSNNGSISLLAAAKDKKTSATSASRSKGKKRSKYISTSSSAPKPIPNSALSPHDVLSGRGAGISSHPGNIAFRHLISARKSCYREAENHGIKNDVAMEVVDLVKGRSDVVVEVLSLGLGAGDGDDGGANGNGDGVNGNGNGNLEKRMRELKASGLELVEMEDGNGRTMMKAVERGWDPPGRFLRQVGSERKKEKVKQKQQQQEQQQQEDSGDTTDEQVKEGTSEEAAAANGEKKKDDDKDKDTDEDEEEEEEEMWIEVSDKVALEKCKQALRQHKWDTVAEKRGGNKMLLGKKEGSSACTVDENSGAVATAAAAGGGGGGAAEATKSAAKPPATRAGLRRSSFSSDRQSGSSLSAISFGGGRPLDGFRRQTSGNASASGDDDYKRRAFAMQQHQEEPLSHAASAAEGGADSMRSIESLLEPTPLRTSPVTAGSSSGTSFLRESSWTTSFGAAAAAAATSSAQHLPEQDLGQEEQTLLAMLSSTSPLPQPLPQPLSMHPNPLNADPSDNDTSLNEVLDLFNGMENMEDDPASLNLMAASMPVIGESTSFVGGGVGRSLSEKVSVARKISSIVRERHESGNAVGFDSIVELLRQSGAPIWSTFDSATPPSSDPFQADLVYLGFVFYELFSAVSPLAESRSSSNREPIGDEEDYSSPPTQKRERSHHQLGSSPISASQPWSCAAPLYERGLPAPLYERGLPVSLSILVSSLLFAADSISTEKFHNAEELEVDLRMMEADPARYLNDAPSNASPSDLLSLSDRLYGRDRHEAILNSALGRISSPTMQSREVLVISGISGAGKSALAEKVGSSIIGRGGFFLKGKFEQSGTIQPLSILCGAFNAYCLDLLNRNDGTLLDIRKDLMEALGADCGIGILANLIPNIRLIFGDTGAGASSLGSQGQGRSGIEGCDTLTQLVFYFRCFIRVIASPSHPIVLYLDDIHYIDSAALELITMFITDTEIKSFLLLGCYRSNEVHDDHPLKTQLANIEEAGTTVTTIRLQNIDRHSINELISDTLHLSPRLTKPLADIVYNKTSGNALFVTRFLRSLWDEHLLTYSAERRRWKWNVASIQSKDIEDNVVGLMTAKIMRLRSDVQNGLKIAACLGSQLDGTVIKLVNSGTQVSGGSVMSFCQVLDVAEKEGLMSGMGSSYKFSHSQIQQAALELENESNRNALHLQIGRMLLKEASKEQGLLENENVLMTTVDQLNRGAMLIHSHGEKIQVARLNLLAGEKAISLSCHLAAFLYLKLGLGFLEDTDWEENYDLCLCLHNLSAEVAYIVGNFDDMSVVLNNILSRARTYDDKLRAYYTLMTSLSAQGKSQDAINTGLDVLSHLGEEFPRDLTEDVIKSDLMKTKMLLKGMDEESIANLEPMNDEQKIAAMRFLNRMAMVAYLMNQRLLPLIAFRIVRLSLCYGICRESAYGISIYALIMAGYLGDASGAARFGKLALKLVQKFDAQEQLARISFVLYGFVFIWTEPIQAAISQNFQAYEIGLKAGDSEYAMKCAMSSLTQAAQTGEPLPSLVVKYKMYTTEMLRNKQLMSYKQSLPQWQACLNLMGQSEDPLRLTGEVMVEDTYLFDMLDSQNLNVCLRVYSCKLWLCAIFGNFEAGKQIIESNFGTKKRGNNAGIGVTHVVFYISIISFSLARRNDDESAKWKRNALEAYDVINTAASNCKWNFQHKLELLQAENYFLAGENARAAKAYEDSIESAERHGFIHEAALFSERAAMFYFAMRNEDRATEFFRKARDSYLQWGATRKAADLDVLC